MIPNYSLFVLLCPLYPGAQGKLSWLNDWRRTPVTFFFLATADVWNLPNGYHKHFTIL